MIVFTVYFERELNEKSRQQLLAELQSLQLGTIISEPSSLVVLEADVQVVISSSGVVEIASDGASAEARVMSEGIMPACTKHLGSATRLYYHPVSAADQGIPASDLLCLAESIAIASGLGKGRLTVRPGSGVALAT